MLHVWCKICAVVCHGLSRHVSRGGFRVDRCSSDVVTNVVTKRNAPLASDVTGWIGGLVTKVTNIWVTRLHVGAPARMHSTHMFVTSVTTKEKNKKEGGLSGDKGVFRSVIVCHSLSPDRERARLMADCCGWMTVTTCQPTLSAIHIGAA